MAGAWYAIIDCAQDSRLLPLVKQCSERECLYAGDLNPDLEATAPWIVRINDRDPLLSTWQTHGRGLNWGIMCEATLQMADLRRHFRKFLQAKLPDGMIVLFRFFDPRVFNTYIRALAPDERAPWFQNISQYAVEGADPQVMHQYRLSNGSLVDGHDVIG